MEKNTLVSIIIVNYNGKQLLQSCIESIKENDYKNYEILVVDNNSEDDSIDHLTRNFPSTKIIKLQQNYGFSYPNNLAAKKAKGEFLLFLNNDTVITKNSIPELIKILQSDESIGICQSQLVKPSGRIDSSGDFLHVSGLPYSSTKTIEKTRKIFSARGAALFVRTNHFHNLGGFNEKFFATFEDVDLCWRSWIYGSEVVLVPNSIVYHKGSETIKKLEKTIQSHSFKNFLLLNLLNLESERIFSFLFFLPKIFFIKNKPNPLKHMNSPSAKQIFSGFFWVIKNLRYIQRVRKTINSKRTVSTNQLTKMRLISSDFQ